MALTGWIAKHTGLPSLMATGGEPVYAGDRLLAVPGIVRDPHTTQWWADLRRHNHQMPMIPKTMLVSDAFAVPGTTITYRQGDSAVSLTRPPGDWYQILLSRLNGRTIPGIAWDGDGDKREWTSSVKHLTPGLSRWSLTTPVRTGTATITLLDPEDGELVWDLLRSPEPLIALPGVHVEGLPPRFVTVDKAVSKRVGAGQLLEWSVSWTEVPEDSPMLCGETSGWGAAPVVTWAEWDRAGHGWRNRTYLDLCKTVAGMP